MAKRPQPPLSEAVVAAIRADAQRGVNWAELVAYGPACCCGLHPRMKARCYRHGTAHEEDG